MTTIAAEHATVTAKAARSLAIAYEAFFSFHSSCMRAESDEFLAKSEASRIVWAKRLLDIQTETGIEIVPNDRLKVLTTIN